MPAHENICLHAILYQKSNFESACNFVLLFIMMASGNTFTHIIQGCFNENFGNSIIVPILNTELTSTLIWL